MDEGKLRLAADKGLKAKALLENEILKEAFATIENALMQEWKETRSEDSLRREDAWRSYKLLNGLKSYLNRLVSTGEASTKELLQVKNPSILKRFK